MTISAPTAASASACATSAPGMARASASCSSTRTTIPPSISRLAEVRARSTMSRRPVCAVNRTRRCPFWAVGVSTSVTEPPRRRPAPGPAPQCARTAACSSGTLLDGSPDVVLLGRRGVAPQPQEELHVPSRTGQGAGHDTGGPPAERLRRPRHLEHGPHPVFGLAPHPPGAEPLPPDLELRLDHREEVGIIAGAGGERRQHEAQRDEGEVGDHHGPRPADGLRRQGADVGALQHLDAFVGAQRPGEPAVAHVDGDDLRCPAPQQDVCEPAGRGAGVQRPPPLDGDAERLQGTEQLVRAARDPAGLVRVGADDQRGAGVDSGGRLGGSPTGDGDASLGDQGHGVLTGSGQAPPHELRVESTAADHQSWSIVPSSRCSRSCSASKRGTGSGPGHSSRSANRSAPLRSGSAWLSTGAGAPGPGRGGAGSVRSALGSVICSPLGVTEYRRARRLGAAPWSSVSLGGYRPGTTGTVQESGRYGPAARFETLLPPWRPARVATMDQCMTALQGILGELAAKPAAAGLDRSMSCRLTDLGQVIVGRLSSGSVKDVHALPDDPSVPKADIRLTMTSDDLVALTEGRLSFAPAWASGRIKFEAGLRDILRLRSPL